jgi:hypothetical protein
MKIKSKVRAGETTSTTTKTQDTHKSGSLVYLN